MLFGIGISIAVLAAVAFVQPVATAVFRFEETGAAVTLTGSGSFDLSGGGTAVSLRRLSQIILFVSVGYVDWLRFHHVRRCRFGGRARTGALATAAGRGGCVGVVPQEAHGLSRVRDGAATPWPRLPEQQKPVQRCGIATP